MVTYIFLLLFAVNYRVHCQQCFYQETSAPVDNLYVSANNAFILADDAPDQQYINLCNSNSERPFVGISKPVFKTKSCDGFTTIDRTANVVCSNFNPCFESSNSNPCKSSNMPSNCITPISVNFLKEEPCVSSNLPTESCISLGATLKPTSLTASYLSSSIAPCDTTLSTNYPLIFTESCTQPPNPSNIVISNEQSIVSGESICETTCPSASTVFLDLSKYINNPCGGSTLTANSFPSVNFNTDCSNTPSNSISTARSLNLNINSCVPTSVPSNTCLNPKSNKIISNSCTNSASTTPCSNLVQNSCSFINSIAESNALSNEIKCSSCANLPSSCSLSLPISVNSLNNVACTSAPMLPSFTCNNCDCNESSVLQSKLVNTANTSPVNTFTSQIEFSFPTSAPSRSTCTTSSSCSSIPNVNTIFSLCNSPYDVTTPVQQVPSLNCNSNDSPCTSTVQLPSFKTSLPVASFSPFLSSQTCSGPLVSPTKPSCPEPSTLCASLPLKNAKPLVTSCELNALSQPCSPPTISSYSNTPSCIQSLSEPTIKTYFSIAPSLSIDSCEPKNSMKIPVVSLPPSCSNSPTYTSYESLSFSSPPSCPSIELSTLQPKCNPFVSTTSFSPCLNAPSLSSPIITSMPSPITTCLPPPPTVLPCCPTSSPVIYGRPQEDNSLALSLANVLQLSVLENLLGRLPSPEQNPCGTSNSCSDISVANVEMNSFDNNNQNYVTASVTSSSNEPVTFGTIDDFDTYIPRVGTFQPVTGTETSISSASINLVDDEATSYNPYFDTQASVKAISSTDAGNAFASASITDVNNFYGQNIKPYNAWNLKDPLPSTYISQVVRPNIINEKQNVEAIVRNINCNNNPFVCQTYSCPEVAPPCFNAYPSLSNLDSFVIDYTTTLSQPNCEGNEVNCYISPSQTCNEIVPVTYVDTTPTFAYEVLPQTYETVQEIIPYEIIDTNSNPVVTDVSTVFENNYNSYNIPTLSPYLSQVPISTQFAPLISEVAFSPYDCNVPMYLELLLPSSIPAQLACVCDMPSLPGVTLLLEPGFEYCV